MSNLKVYAKTIEDEALEQINTLLSQDAFKDCKVRIMPDVHGIHDDRVTVLTGRMDAVDERALGVGLEYRAVHAEPLAFLDDLGIDGSEGVRAVDARLAHARQIEVGSVDE